MDGEERRSCCNSIAIIHNQAFVAHALSEMLTENGFDPPAELLLDQIAQLDGETQINLFIVGPFKTSESLQHDCAAIRQQNPISKIALVDAGISSAALHAAKSQRLDAYLSLDLEPLLLLHGLRLALAGTQCFPRQTGSAAANSEEMKSRDVFGLSDLTPRECEILRLVSSGAANKVIAWKLGIAEGTVKAHINSVLRKTDLSNRTEAARWAISHGLIEESSPDV